MIKIRGLFKNYGSLSALKNINLDIEEGEILGLLGPNGAGKSSLIKIITGTLPYEFGEVQIADMDLLDYSYLKNIKQLIGYLPENCPLYEDMRVQDFLSFLSRIRGLKKENLEERLEVVLNAVGLLDRRWNFISSLSKGYRQRVGIAQALMHNPKILILDEPSSGLDPSQMREIRDLIRNLKQNRTIILSTHILSEVSQICDRIVIITNGEIKTDGTESQLLEKFSENRITLKINKNHPSLIDILKAVEGVDSVQVDAKEGQSSVRVFIEYKKDKDPSYEIIKTLVKNELVFSEIRKKTLSLEEAFIRIIES